MQTDQADILTTTAAAAHAAAGELGLPPEIARALAERIEVHVRSEHGGESVYIKSLASRDRHERNAAIREGYRSGARMAELAVKFGLTEARVRQIVR
jgi:Mor family transcriptional regulator